MLLKPLVSTIEMIKARIDTHGPTLRENETRTRMALIDPLLQALGWDTSDPSTVLPEFDVSGRKADYALLDVSGKPSATIEAKKLGESLATHRMQMLNYSNASDVEFAGLTDGDKWELYEVFKRGQLDERRVLDVSIANTPSPEAALKLLLLWRPNLVSGQPVAASPSIVDTTAAVASRSAIRDADATVSQTAPIPLPDASIDWIPLSSIEDVTGKKAPVEIRFSDGQTRPLRAWWRLLTESAEFLVQKDILTTADCPIDSGRGWQFINSVPHSPNGKNYITPKTISNGIFMETHLSSKATVSYAKRLLTHFGISLATVGLRFE